MTIFLSQAIFSIFRFSWSFALFFINLLMIIFWLLVFNVMCTSCANIAKFLHTTYAELAILFTHVWDFSKAAQAFKLITWSAMSLLSSLRSDTIKSRCIIDTLAISWKIWSIDLFCISFIFFLFTIFTRILRLLLHFIISTTSFTWKINNVYMLFTRHHCCHLHQLHIIYIIYNVIYTHYNQRWIIIQSKVSFFLVFLQRFEDFYQELLERINECTSSFIKVNKDINYWDQEWTHLKKKIIVMMNWLIEIKSKIKVKDWIEDQIWISSETLSLCQDII